MNEEYIRQLDDVKFELGQIKKWIDQEHNRTDTKARFLISYAIIRASGTIEQVFKQTLFDKLSYGTCEENNNFLSKHIIDSSCNPSTKMIERFLEEMSNNWKEKFKRIVKEEAIKEKSELNSLVQWRNDFAHGRSNTNSIESVIASYKAGITILNILDKVIKTNSQVPK